MSGSLRIYTLDRDLIGWKGGFITEEVFDIDCEGTGTEEDPFIIDRSIYYYIGLGHLELRDSNKKILIQECSKKVIYSVILNNCENIIIKNCDFRSIGLKDCSKIKFENSTISSIMISHSKNIEIYNCAINKLKLKKSNLILIKDSNIFRVKEKKCLDINYS